jgi:K+-transporting ATPase ATPase C chain
MKNIITGLKLFLVLTILTGLAYPAVITLVAQAFFYVPANGDPYLIGQKFDQNKYFWSRPSASNYGTLPSGGSNLSATSKSLKEIAAKRKEMILASDKDKRENQIPSDLIYASGSGLDPHISVASAIYQADRIARERQLPKAAVLALIAKASAGRDFAIFGERRVNVLRLNELLDKNSSSGVK